MLAGLSKLAKGVSTKAAVPTAAPASSSPSRETSVRGTAVAPLTSDFDSPDLPGHAVGTPSSTASGTGDPVVDALGADPESDATIFGLLRHILAAKSELGDIKPLQAACSLYFLLNHPERSEALDEDAERDPTAELPPDCDMHCRAAVAAYATSTAKALAALGPAFSLSDILFAQFASNSMQPAHLLVVSRAQRVIYLCIRGTASMGDAVKDLAGSAADFCGSMAHVGMATSANSFFSQRYSDRVSKSAWWPTSAATGTATTVVGSTGDVGSSGRVVGLPGVVEALWAVYPGFRFMIVGHSLGAGIGALVCCKLRATLHRITLWRAAAGCPSALPLTKETAPTASAPTSAVSSSSNVPSLDPVTVSTSTAATSVVPVESMKSPTPQPKSASAAFISTLTLDDMAACTAPVQACLFATPACASPELSALCSMTPAAAAACVGVTASGEVDAAALSSTPIVCTVVVGNDVVPRLSVLSARRLHDKLADPVLSAAANAEAYAETMKAGYAAVTTMWNNVTGGPSGRVQTTGRAMLTSAAELVGGVRDSPRVTAATELVTSSVNDLWRRFNRHATPHDMAPAYAAIGPGEAGITATVSGAPPIMATVSPASSGSSPANAVTPTSTPAPVTATPVVTAAVIRKFSEAGDGGATVGAGARRGSSDSSSGVGTDAASVAPAAAAAPNPAEAAAPACSAALRTVCEDFKSESCVPDQKLCAPGVIYHITRVASPGKEAVAADAIAAHNSSTPLSAPADGTVSAAPTKLHAALTSQSAAADAVDIHDGTHTSEVVADAEVLMAADAFRIHVIPPSRLAHIRVARTMISDHSKRVILVSIEAAMAAAAARTAPTVPLRTSSAAMPPLGSGGATNVMHV